MRLKVINDELRTKDGNNDKGTLPLWNEKEALLDRLIKDGVLAQHLRELDSQWKKFRSKTSNNLSAAYRRLRKRRKLNLAAHFEASIRSESCTFVYSAPQISWFR